MTRQLLLVHGRSQQGKDATALKATWLAALARGLRKSSLELPIAESDVRFPFYGDTLDDMVKDVPADQVADIVIRGAADGELQRRFMADVLAEVKVAAGISNAQVEENLDAEIVERGPQNWEWVLGIVRALDRHVPGASGAAVAIHSYDVFQYLTNFNVRHTIDEGVEQAVDPQSETVVVGHSLGSVVAFNVLRHAGAAQHWHVPLFLTLGSPLGVSAVRKGLRAIRREAHPTCVNAWHNARDRQDIVALYNLAPPQFAIDPPVSNTSHVDNHTQNRHGINGYLDDALVAKQIYDALVSPS